MIATVFRNLLRSNALNILGSLNTMTIFYQLKAQVHNKGIGSPHILALKDSTVAP
jgi:hypothetical protein